ncbi:hypothetical protein [Alloalcanivorax xenomutans]|uniref:hypothetical protein n=1 Tax=Alloalcanivorax xenomutans TaxID=1094342 RepID=UPI0003B821F6|nr:hypothetical protein Q668_18750 [Alcanivorax sp. PN-3]
MYYYINHLTGLQWHRTIKALDKRRLQVSVGDFDSGDACCLLMDEIAMYKGHRYATVIMDVDQP